MNTHTRPLALRAIARLAPAETSRNPAFFLLEVAAALVTVLALRDHLQASPSAMPETILAAGLWGVAMAIALARAVERGER
jgi:high-affinity K+ transport system ATPase subunit B